MPGVRVGHCTVSWGGPELPHGSGPARTGVTAIFPHGGDLWHERVVAGAHAANGVGELIGISAVREWGLVETPILLTNSQSAGAVYDATIRWLMEREPLAGIEDAVMPVVGECDDGFLNDLRGLHVREEHVRAALDGAADGPVAEGCVGAGTGMTCFDFKAGIGTSSRVVPRARTLLDGRRAGADQLRRAPPAAAWTASPWGARSPTSCRWRTARARASSSSPRTRRSARGSASAWPSAAPSGLAATGSYASDGSGEIMLAFSTAHRVPRVSDELLALATVANDHMYGLFEAAVDATAESVCNALTAATTTVGRDGNTAYELPLDRLVGVLRRAGREARLPGA